MPQTFATLYHPDGLILRFKSAEIAVANPPTKRYWLAKKVEYR